MSKMPSERRYLDFSGHNLIWVEDQHIEACMQQVQDGVVDGIAMGPLMGYGLPDINFLRFYPDLKGVVVLDAKGIDLSALSCLRHLEFLSVADSAQPLDLGLYPRLREAWLQWHDGVRLPEAGSVLRVLALHNFRPQGGDLDSLPALPQLEDLSLIQSTIRSLEGIGKHEGLRRVELSYCAKLKVLKGILPLAGRLRVLELERCPSILDYEILGGLTSLEILLLNGCAKIPSLEFVATLKSLRQLRFVGTDVVDGDMTPLMTHGALEGTAFTAKRHFSHKPREVQESLDEGRRDR